MEVSNATASALNALQSVQAADSARSKFGVTLLKKTLEMQQQQTAQLMSMMEGKGQVVDVRV